MLIIGSAKRPTQSRLHVRGWKSTTLIPSLPVGKACLCPMVWANERQVRACWRLLETVLFSDQRERHHWTYVLLLLLRP